jgi:hypothetical protein
VKKEYILEARESDSAAHTNQNTVYGDSNSGTYRFHLQGRKISPARNLCESRWQFWTLPRLSGEVPSKHMPRKMAQILIVCALMHQRPYYEADSRLGSQKISTFYGILRFVTVCKRTRFLIMPFAN